MVIYFITKNTGKFQEVQHIIPNLIQLSIDLDEIQEIDPKKIIAAKLKQATKHCNKGCVVDDTSLYMDCLNGLPGPLIKWFLNTIGNDGLAELAKKNIRARASSILGYAKNNSIQFFESTLIGTIVRPRGKNGFGFDPIFQPDGHTKTLAEMSFEEKNKIIMRRLAAEKLKQYLYYSPSDSS